MIKFSETEFDLGNVIYGQNKSVTVTITNTGSDVIKLSVANSSCSCTTGTIIGPLLNPGGSSQFVIDFNSIKSGSGQNQAKSISLTYTIKNATLNQLFRLKINVV